MTEAVQSHPLSDIRPALNLAQVKTNSDKATVLAALLADQQRRMLESPFWQAEDRERFASQNMAADPRWQRLAVASDYAIEQLGKHPDWLVQLLAEDHCLPVADAEDTIRQCADENALKKLLRLRRHRHMVSIIWRDANRLVPTLETTAALSDLADSSLELALQWHTRELQKRYGQPMGQDSDEVQQLVVLGMGKLGAGELNLSSDIDLIFCFEEKGETRGGRSVISNEEYFAKLGQKLIQALDQMTADGFVFRVDMRLRPYGTAGALAPSFPAMESYYQEQGRDWERYAMIKARVVAGDQAAGERLMAMLRPFVYRRYLDYSAFESLRSMKLMINREVRRKGLESNVKLGRGGIREVEFIAQAFQLIRGGRDRRLQQRGAMQILPLLVDVAEMPVEVITALQTAYCYLRDVEHGIQMLADQQTQNLPEQELACQRLAWTLGEQDWTQFLAVLEAHRSQVREHFDAVITLGEEEEAEDSDEEMWATCWISDQLDDSVVEWLAGQGFAEPAAASQALIDLRESKAWLAMQAVGRTRLDAVMPVLLAAVVRYPQPDITLKRVLGLVEAVLRRTAYLVLLQENPLAVEQLVRLSHASPWFSDQLSRYPVLLDELIEPAVLYRPLDKAGLRAELQQLLLRVPEQDTEQILETLRYFRRAQALRIAAADVTGVLPLMKVSDNLTWVAEVIVEQILDHCWQQLISKHGRPLREDGEPCNPDFIVVGYGKMGGIELSYGSDLDLVFIHNADSQGETEGPERRIANQVFFTRLGQKIIHSLTALTSSGLLYKVDMRLRPSGGAGLLVSSLKAFEQYQLNDAWHWEHQALVRARPVAGDPALMTAFDKVRQQILARTRENDTIKAAVVEMRSKMRDVLASPATLPAFNLKQDAGGIVDIEFLVQYLVLANGAKHPSLLVWSDNVRILEAAVAADLLTPEQADTLREAYLFYRGLANRLTLVDDESGMIAREQVSAYQQKVEAIWQTQLG
ncbi:bifunctional [glutamate--ammonia ligase]-adenylyl-L-tyrosine phosphorylase/[glutamate--ammonia-ligase] adenylyltransferase [Pokkaliibacter sp. CJK22405]|uniref:bifunctional [glutamate--ammonia ligase]-adenylyl-L-tyrosine phosphorylase/[glutamate--ammonia-ligase] adenylyltransferase n=1 Tax=Pokkaliibacter sp. CJK22405 TaxID=3384615 RepID=UPI0039850781